MSGEWLIPVLSIMDRHYSIETMEKSTLASLGISGNVLVRLNFEKKKDENEVNILKRALEIEAEDSSKDIPVMESKSLVNKPPQAVTDKNPVQLQKKTEQPSENNSKSNIDEKHTEVDKATRNAVVFLPPTGIPVSAAAITSDEDYEMTNDHARMYQSVLSANARKLTNGAELLTRAQRSERELAKRRELKNVCLFLLLFPLKLTISVS